MREIQKILTPDEKIVWEGAPQMKPYMVGVLGAAIGTSMIIGWPLAYVLTGADSGRLPPLLAALPVSIVPIVFLVIIAAITGLGYLRFMNTYYAVTEKRILLQSGIIGRDFKTIDFDRITNVEVKVGLMDKIFGQNSGTISITTPDSVRMQQVRNSHPAVGMPGSNMRQGYHTEMRIVPTKLTFITNPYSVFAFIKKIPYDMKANMFYPNELRPSMNPVAQAAAPVTTPIVAPVPPQPLAIVPPQAAVRRKKTKRVK